MTPMFDVPRHVKPIVPARDVKKVRSDLELLRERALANGASVVELISREDIIFSDAVRTTARADDGYPSFNWPLDLPKDDLTEAMRAYEYGIMIGIHSENPLPAYGGGPITVPAHKILFIQLHELVTDIESTSFYMGYQLALGLAPGNCRALFCDGEERCWAMLKGRGCIHPYKARPSPEIVGVDTKQMGRMLSIPGSDDGRLMAGLVMVV